MEAAPSAAEPADEMLVAGLASGQIDALDRLYRRYATLTYSVGLRVLGDRQLAEDVVQEVFLRLWRRPWSYDPARGRFRSWLLSVVRNRAIDERRRLGRRQRQEQRDELADGLEPAGPQPFADPQLEAELGEAREAVRRALAALPPAQREVLDLAYFGGLTQVEIAAQTGTPLGTVKTRVRLGMQKLRAELDGLRPGGLP